MQQLLKATTDVENPLKALLVPRISLPFNIISPLFGLPNFSVKFCTGLKTSSNMINPNIRVADTGYETASVTHMITANAKITKVAFAIIGKPAGVGNNKIVIKITKLMIIHIGL